MLPEGIQYIGQYSYFLNNFDVMFFAMLAFLSVASMLYLVSKLMEIARLNYFAICLLKQGLLTFVIFNILNMSFSMGTFIKYATKTP